MKFENLSTFLKKGDYHRAMFVRLGCVSHLQHSNCRSKIPRTQVDKDASERISYVNSVLTIETAIASDAGHYQCLAVNQYNDDRKDTTLMLMS